MDKFGRKKVIVCKVVMTILMLIPLIILGYINSDIKNVPIVFSFYFLALFFSTFTFDLMLYGFETQPKENRDNYVIILAATRIVGIAIVSITFYFLNKWVYFMIIEVGLLIIMVSLFIKYNFETPLQIMVSTGDHDLCKFVLNSISIKNEQKIVNEKLAFSLSQ
jgi:MFS family permease